MHTYNHSNCITLSQLLSLSKQGFLTITGTSLYRRTVRAHTMRTSIIFSLILLLLGCTNSQQSKLSGIWDASNYLHELGDTIQREGDFDTDIEKTTVKTDSGIMVIAHIEDSILNISPATKTSVIQFHFDDDSRGVLSIYQIDSVHPTSDNDPRMYANNYNFWTISSNGRTYIVIDQQFYQFGRALDTLEYKIISTQELAIEDKTLKRLYEP